MKKIIIICLAILVLVSAVGATKITLFVIPPIGAIPEGKILVIHRLEKTKFIDSPDAMCERIQGGLVFYAEAWLLQQLPTTMRLL